MSLLPASDDGTQWQMTSLDYDVLLIQNPGTEQEEVIIRFDGRDRPKYRIIQNTIMNSSRLTVAQKFYAMFWLGYFYKSLCANV